MKTPEELFNEVFKAYLRNLGNKDEAINLIKQAKSEWCKEFLTWYCKKYELTFTDWFKDQLIKSFLNAPEPE